jgi:hypothetical protein
MLKCNTQKINFKYKPLVIIRDYCNNSAVHSDKRDLSVDYYFIFRFCYELISSAASLFRKTVYPFYLRIIYARLVSRLFAWKTQRLYIFTQAVGVTRLSENKLLLYYYYSCLARQLHGTAPGPS